MESKITLELLSAQINDLALVTRRGFGYAEQKFKEIDARFEVVDKRFEALDERLDQDFIAVAQQFEIIDKRFDAVEQRLTKLEQRVDLIGYSVYNIQVQTENMDQEMKDIHKVIDNLNGRLIVVENYLGFPNQSPLFEF